MLRLISGISYSICMQQLSQLLQVRKKLVFIDGEQMLVSALRTAVVKTTNVWLPVDWIRTPISSTLWTMSWWLRVVMVAVCVWLAIGVTMAMARIGTPTVV